MKPSKERRGGPFPSRYDRRIPTYTNADHDETDEEEKIQMIDEDDVGNVEEHEVAKVENRASSALKQDMSNYGLTDKCRGCLATERGWKHVVAHSDICRDRVMPKILEEGDRDARVEQATKKALEEANNCIENHLIVFVSDKKNRKPPISVILFSGKPHEKSSDMKWNAQFHGVATQTKYSENKVDDYADVIVKRDNVFFGVFNLIFTFITFTLKSFSIFFLIVFLFAFL